MFTDFTESIRSTEKKRPVSTKTQQLSPFVALFVYADPLKLDHYYFSWVYIVQNPNYMALINFMSAIVKKCWKHSEHDKSNCETRLLGISSLTLYWPKNYLFFVTRKNALKAASCISACNTSFQPVVASINP